MDRGGLPELAPIWSPGSQRSPRGKSYVPPYDFASIYEGLGEKEQAIDWLEKAYEEGNSYMGLKVNPIWDRLRSHPRYQALLRRMGLAQ